MCDQDRTPYEQIAQRALTLMQQMDDRLHHLRFDFGFAVAVAEFPPRHS
ncbi:unnamed protein product, partial [Rotaria sp. Silwood2]